MDAAEALPVPVAAPCQSLRSWPRSRGMGAAGWGSGLVGQRGIRSRSLSVMLGSGCFSHSPCNRGQRLRARRVEILLPRKGRKVLEARCSCLLGEMTQALTSEVVFSPNQSVFS